MERTSAVHEDARPGVQLAVLTPAGRGAIATVAVRGRDAAALVGRFFAPASGQLLEARPAGSVAFGRFHTGSSAEELVVGRISEEEVEIHCHGGSAAVHAIKTALVTAGATEVTWQQFAMNNIGDAIQAEALIALAGATTQRTAAILLDQYRGALAGELERIIELIATARHDLVQEALDALARNFDLGRHLAGHWTIAIAGRPNAGKSTLLNALLGYKRAIVSPQPGTTRDVLSAQTAIDGWPVEMLDTAGLRDAAETLELEGIKRARRHIAAADLVMHVLDSTDPWRKEDDLEPGVRGRRIVVHNKLDLAAPPADGRPDGLAVSAANGTGLGELLQAISQALVPHPPPQGSPVPFTERQMARIARAQSALARKDIVGASDALLALRSPNDLMSANDRPAASM